MVTANKMHKQVTFLWGEIRWTAIKLIYVMTAMKEYQNKKILWQCTIQKLWWSYELFSPITSWYFAIYMRFFWGWNKSIIPALVLHQEVCHILHTHIPTTAFYVGHRYTNVQIHPFSQRLGKRHLKGGRQKQWAHNRGYGVQMKLPLLSWSLIQAKGSLLWNIEQKTHMNKHETRVSITE